MPLVPYNPSNSLSRFRSDKNWTKILFRPDNKLQTTEIEEIQDVLLNQISKVYGSLYDFYTVVRGCKVIVTAIAATGYQCILTEGQVYVELFNDQGLFIDVKPKTFTVSRDDITEVGVIFNTSLAKDLPDFRNPHSGGAAFGSEGADRLIITSEVIISPKTSPYTAGFYPLAVIKPKTLSFQTAVQDLGDGRPDILYYRNEELTQVYNERNLSTYIKRTIEQRLYEMAGNFISYGMQIIFDTESEVLSITPGVAYINGKRIQTNSNYSYKIDISGTLNGELNVNRQYLFFLKDTGRFDFISDVSSLPYVLEAPPESLPIGYLILDGYDSISQLVYNILPAKTRMPKVSEIIALEKSNIDNNKDLANLALQVDLLNNSQNNINASLNGIFVDSFVDLDNSDITSPEFNASILPAIQAVSLPFTSENRDNRTFTLNTEESNVIFDTIQNENNESVFYWATIDGNDQILFDSSNITSSLVLPVTTEQSLNVRVSPSVIYKSDESTFINYTHPDIKTLTGLSEPVVIDTPFNDNSYRRTVNIYASGFVSNQDNIRVDINNVNITAFNMIEGTVGATLGTVKANESGNVSFTFQIPTLEQADNYIISLSSASVSASAEIFIIDPEVQRTSRELNSQYIINEPPSYSTVNMGIAQQFIIDQPIMLKALEITIVDYPEISEGTLVNVYITKADSIGRPTDETIAFGHVDISEVSLLTQDRPVPNPTRITLDKPALLDRGTYCIVLQTSIPNVQVGVTEPGASSLVDGRSFASNIDNLGFLHIRSTQGWNIDITKFLDFKLISHRPLSQLSSTVLELSTIEGQEFDILDINLTIESQNRNGFISVYVQDSEGIYRLVENGSFFFKSPVLNTKVRIDLQGDSYIHPILRLDNASFNLLKSGRSAAWVSKNQQYETPYNSLSLSLDVYQPDSSTYTYYFSSDQGVTWEELNSSTATVTTEVVNEQLPVIKYTFRKDNLGFINDKFRTELRYKVEIEQNNLDGIYPFFKNLVSITNP